MIKQNFTIDEGLMDKLRNHSKKTGLKMSTIVRCGLHLYFVAESLKEKKKNGKCKHGNNDN